MSEVRDLLARQAAWQKSLRSLPWAEKIRMAENLRQSVEMLRATRRSKHNPDTHPEVSGAERDQQEE